MDLFEQSYWTAAQAMLWIYARDKKLVESATTNYVGALRLELRVNLNRSTVPGYPITEYTTIDAAQESLLHQLRNDLVKAVGQEHGGAAMPKNIPREHWTASEHFNFKMNQWGPWHNVQMPMAQILESWPCINAPSETELNASGERVPGEQRNQVSQSSLLGRPDDVSDNAWKTYLEACNLKPAFWDKRNGVSDAARAVAKSRGRPANDSEGERRSINRVLSAIRKKVGQRSTAQVGQTDVTT